ncbi:bacterial Ig-like domain-containing protein, partial [Vagococcus fessus]|uniref:bacterial Ig-like domain-containing protein n=1 Tax=Vagococcus fessus TaxID=120370 RepID=UPI0039EC4F86
MEAANSTIVVGSEWHAKDNFVQATDKLGNDVSLDKVKVNGMVDTSKPGEYQISYSYEGMSIRVTVTVVEKPERPEVWPGEEINLTSINVQNSMVTVGTAWEAKDNFVSATDKQGKPVGIGAVNVSGEVDTSKVGDYNVTYTYGGMSISAIVTVVEVPERPEVWPGEEINQTSLLVQNSTLTVGSEWTGNDNFIQATDRLGNPIGFDQIKVEGTVDTTRTGEYQVTYRNQNVIAIATITVVEKPERPEVWPGEEVDYSDINVQNSTLAVGTAWEAKANFVSATNKQGQAVEFSLVKVDGHVDTTKVGEYQVAYSYANQVATATIT